MYIDNDVECYSSMEGSLKGLDLALNCELRAPPGKVGRWRLLAVGWSVAWSVGCGWLWSFPLGGRLVGWLVSSL